MTLANVLLVFSFVLLVLAAFEVGAPKVSLGWLGLALFVLTFIVK